jgi:hypothetical protein
VVTIWREVSSGLLFPATKAGQRFCGKAILSRQKVEKDLAGSEEEFAREIFASHPPKQ